MSWLSHLKVTIISNHLRRFTVEKASSKPESK